MALRWPHRRVLAREERAALAQARLEHASRMLADAQQAVVDARLQREEETQLLEEIDRIAATNSLATIMRDRILRPRYE